MIDYARVPDRPANCGTAPLKLSDHVRAFESLQHNASASADKSDECHMDTGEHVSDEQKPDPRAPRSGGSYMWGRTRDAGFVVCMLCGRQRAPTDTNWLRCVAGSVFRGFRASFPVILRKVSGT
eukprot:SAG11_NODE_3982_length_2121_cov_16.286350_2_plen_124_part_00